MLSKNIDVFEKLSKSLRLAKGDLDLVGSADDIDGVFSPNIGSADDIKRIQGQIGQELRKIDSNYKTGGDIEAAIKAIDDLSKNYGYKGEVDILRMSRFLNGVKNTHIGDRANTLRAITDSSADKAAQKYSGVKQKALGTLDTLNKLDQPNLGIGKKRN